MHILLRSQGAEKKPRLRTTDLQFLYINTTIIWFQCVTQNVIVTDDKMINWLID